MLNLAKYFKSTEEQETFISNIEDIKYDLKNEYQFLVLDDAIWDKLLEKAILMNQKKLDIYSIKRTVIKFLTNYINKKIRNNETWLTSNLLIMLSKDSRDNKIILKRFFQKLEEFKVNISDEYFEILKSTKIFQNILNNMGISNYSKKEVMDFLKDKKSKYGRKTLSERIKRNKSLSKKEHEQLIEYLLSLRKKSEQKCVNDYIDGKFTSSNKRYKTVINVIGILEREYTKYCTQVLKLEEKFSKKQDYIELIIEIIFEEFNIKLANISQNKQELYMQDLRTIEYIYNNKMSKEEYLKLLRTKIINLYQNGNTTLESILVSFIKSEQENIAKEKILEQELSNQRNFIPLKDRIKKIEDITNEEHIIILATFFNELDIETKIVIRDYILGKFTSKDKRYDKVRIGMSSIKNKYRKYGKDIFITRKPISERISKDDILTNEEHCKMLRIIFESLTKEKQESIIAYINKKFDSRDPRFRIFKTALDEIRRKYEYENENKYFKLLIDVINEYIFVKDTLNFERKKIYNNALRIIFNYYLVSGTTEEEYKIMLRKKIEDIIKDGNSSLDSILYFYIAEEQNLINEENLQR